MSRRLGDRTVSDSYGKGVVVLEDAEADGTSHAEEVCERLRATFKSPDFAPPVLPAAAIDVHRMSQMPNVKFEQVLATLEKDPMLAARVLRVASSPVYGGAPLQSLHQAITRLGLRNLGIIVWEVALNMRVFRSKIYEGPMEEIRKHSVAVAYTCREVAKLTPVPLEYAFLCGLLHDVGAAAVLILLGEITKGPQPKPLDSTTLEFVLATAHADVSQLVAKLWHLPADMQFVLGHHHTVVIDGYAHPTAAIVAVAESLVAAEGAAFKQFAPSWDTTNEMALRSARQALSIDDRAFAVLRAEVCLVLERMDLL